MIRQKNNLQIFRIFAAAAAWFGSIGHSINYLVSTASEGISFEWFTNSLFYLSTFTTQTNLLVAIWLTAAVYYGWREKQAAIVHPRVKGAVTTYILVTFTIFATLLAGRFDFVGMEQALNIASHYVVPVLFILDWVLFTERGTVTKKDGLYWLVYPLFYLVYMLVYAELTGVYFYYFADVSALGWGPFALNVVLLLVYFIFLGQVVIAVNRRGKQAEKA